MEHEVYPQSFKRERVDKDKIILFRANEGELSGGFNEFLGQ